MELLLPEPPAPAIPIENVVARSQYAGLPRAYDMRLTSSTQDTYLKNLYAFEEEVIDEEDVASDLGEDEDIVVGNPVQSQRRGSAAPARMGPKKKRLTALTGTVSNETALQPQRKVVAPSNDRKARVQGSRSLITPEYREILRNRRIQSSTPKRSVKMMEETDAGGNNMLDAGVGKGHVKSRATNIILAASQARSNEPPEKFARMPRNELLDLLFTLFDRYKHWSLKRLREETRQPYVYLREVLLTIADQHHNGPYAGSWSLKREYADGRREQSEASPSQAKKEGMDSSGA